MGFDRQIMQSFLDELDSIQKVAAKRTFFQGLASGAKGMFRRVGKGQVSQMLPRAGHGVRAGGGLIGKGLTGAGGVNWGRVGHGLGMMAPAAAGTAAGGAALYGGGKMMFGGHRQ